MLTTGIPASAAAWNAFGTSSTGIEPVTMAEALASIPCCMQVAIASGFDLPSHTSTFRPATSRASSSEAPTAWNRGTWYVAGT